MYSTGTVHVWTDSVFLSQTRLHYKVSNVTTLFVLSDLFLSLYLFTQKTSCTFCVFLFSSARSSLRHNAQPAHASSIFHSAQHQGHNLGSKNLQHDQRNATHAEHVTHTTNKQIQLTIKEIIHLNRKPEGLYMYEGLLRSTLPMYAG